MGGEKGRVLVLPEGRWLCLKICHVMSKQELLAAFVLMCSS